MDIVTLTLVSGIYGDLNKNLTRLADRACWELKIATKH